MGVGSDILIYIGSWKTGVIRQGSDSGSVGRTVGRKAGSEGIFVKLVYVQMEPPIPASNRP